jgi:S-DNA-T family DNA segregation ATPase FtsK/SpoIIIE
VLTGVIWWVTLRNTGSHALSLWLLAWGVFLTSWFTGARLIGAWTQDMLFALVTGFAILAPLGPTAIGKYRENLNRDPGMDERRRQQAELASWVRFFTRVTKVRGVQVTSVVRHANGVEVHGYLGKATDEHGVVTFGTLKDLGEEIATDLRLAGDAVMFQQPDPDNAAAFVMHVRTRKGKRKIAYLPENARITSVNDPIELGLFDNGKPFRMLFREIAVMIVGVIGAGKSNLLQVIIGQAARCEDALVFVIDLKGGRMARPWLMPWVEDPDGVRRPVIDWLATTRAEAKLMLETLIQAGEARSRSGAGGEKITPRRNLPSVILIVDETAVATGHNRKDDGISSRDLAVLLARLVETYRSEAFVPVIAAVRGDVETMGLTAVKAQALARIGLKVSQSGDADSVFPDDHAHAKLLARVQDEGAGLALLKGKMSPPVHFYRVTPKIAYAVARRTGPSRPAPDPVLEAGLGEAYEQRWDRMAETLGIWRATAAEWKAEADIHEDLSKPPAKAGTAVMDRPARPRGEHVGAGDGGPDDYIDAVIQDAIASVTGTAADKIHPARQRMRELLYQARPEGLTAGALHKTLNAEASRSGNPELAVHRGTLHTWLRQEYEAGRLRREGGRMGDPYAKWIWISQPGDDSPIGGLSGGPRDGEDPWP